LAQAQPLAEQCLGDASWAVGRLVVGVRAVGAGYPADVLSGEGLAQLLGLPELGRQLGRGDELVPRGSLASGALAFMVVRR
jgi:hypothetical protein